MEKEKLIALVKKAQKGDDSAVTELYQAHWPDLYYFILKNVNNLPHFGDNRNSS